MRCSCGDIDCEVSRGVGWMCTGDTPEGKAETERSRIECEKERNTMGIPYWLAYYVGAQQSWSADTFGPGRRTLGITAHIRKELAEIEADPDDVREWIDVLILAMDGYWRHGGKPEELAEMLEAKQRVNFERTWPPIAPEDQAMEHLK